MLKGLLGWFVAGRRVGKVVIPEGATSDHVGGDPTAEKVRELSKMIAGKLGKAFPPGWDVVLIVHSKESSVWVHTGDPVVAASVIVDAAGGIHASSKRSKSGLILPKGMRFVPPEA